MDERITTIQHKGKAILYANFSSLKGQEVVTLAQRLPAATITALTAATCGVLTGFVGFRSADLGHSSNYSRNPLAVNPRTWKNQCFQGFSSNSPNYGWVRRIGGGL